MKNNCQLSSSLSSPLLSSSRPRLREGKLWRGSRKKIKIYISLGSNLKNPRKQITKAISALQNLPKSHFLKASSLHETAPIGFLEQPNFINAVVVLETQLSARELLIELQTLETQQGRIRNGEKNRPRTLDLDLLLYGDEIINEPDLIVPHPRMWEREFVLLPLKEVGYPL